MASYTVASLAFLVLAILLLTSWRGRLQGMAMVVAVMLTAIWALSSALYYSPWAQRFAIAAPMLEMLRSIVWCLFLLRLLWPENVSFKDWDRHWRLLAVVLTGVGGVIALVIAFTWANNAGFDIGIKKDNVILLLLGLSILGLLLVEQLFRNARPEKRWGIKYLCLGVGGMFAYDLFMYSDALLFKAVDINLWSARGIVDTLVVPLLAVSAARNPQWSLDIFVSRAIVFHSTTLLGAGIYLMLMAGGGYYIRAYGGEWGQVAQIAFLFGAVLILLMILFSGRYRAGLKVFVNKHFFNYKYDYREEWLRFTHALSSANPNQRPHEQAIQAICAIVDSPGGILLQAKKGGRFEVVARHNFPELQAALIIQPNHPLLTFMRERRWVVDLAEFRQFPEKYQGLSLPDALNEIKEARVIVPMLDKDYLMGLLLLAQPRAKRSFNWEDSDLLKTAARQAAAYIAQYEAGQALIEARQFEAFNRLSAFLVHDLKNLIAQLSLVVSNAEKHKHNPEFMDDAISTIRNSIQRMNRLMSQLRGRVQGVTHLASVDLRKVVEEAMSGMGVKMPIPKMVGDNRSICAEVDSERLVTVLRHVIQNAQEATPAHGKVELRLIEEAGQALIEVKDNGCGMDQEFVKERLFKPFDSTKGKTGMGIGAFETREIVKEMGGDVEVWSRVGLGTIFRIRLPLAASLEKAAVAVEM